MKQIYALAAVLCERAGEAFPQTRGEASAMLDRLKGKAPGARAAPRELAVDSSGVCRRVPPRRPRRRSQTATTRSHGGSA